MTPLQLDVLDIAFAMADPTLRFLRDDQLRTGAGRRLLVALRTKDVSTKEHCSPGECTRYGTCPPGTCRDVELATP